MRLLVASLEGDANAIQITLDKVAKSGKVNDLRL